MLPTSSIPNRTAMCNHFASCFCDTILYNAWQNTIKAFFYLSYLRVFAIILLIASIVIIVVVVIVIVKVNS
jgi:hypothetical protein